MVNNRSNVRCFRALLSVFLFVSALLFCSTAGGQVPEVKIKKRDRKKDVELLTTEGVIILRLSDSTPLHRDNFLRLVKAKYFDSLLFHRVIQNFMIQSGDPNSKRAEPGKPLGGGSPGYMVDAEFRSTLFHKKGCEPATAQQRQSILHCPRTNLHRQGARFYSGGAPSGKGDSAGAKKLL
jgi:cyclophilin family peptidyl-prolyl cis-trans isomerase